MSSVHAIAHGSDSSAWQDWQWQDRTVIELGCGLALCSIAASRMGSKVLATDGDADLVRVAKKNLAVNTKGTRHPVLTVVLPWGQPEALDKAVRALSCAESASSPAAAPSTPSCIDCVIMSDLVYGSDPGVWERLAATLVGLCSAGRDGGSGGTGASSSGRTLVLQCETQRKEGVLYDLYWQTLARAGFSFAPLNDAIDCRVEGGEVKAWVLWLG